MFSEILVPTDGSDSTEKAIRFAAEQIRMEGGRLHLLHVVRDAEEVPSGINEYIHSERIPETPNVVYLEFVGNQIVGAAGDTAKAMGVKDIQSVVVAGDPASEIVRYANDNRVDAVIMGIQEFGRVARRVCQECEQTCVLLRKNPLEGLLVLAVDDDRDVLETLEEALPMCTVKTAQTFEEAKQLLETEPFQIAILDIMGVDGYGLLEVARRRKIDAVMLTAHAFTPEDTIKSHQQGAALYVPKEKMTDIAVYLQDVLEARRKGKHSWWRWFDRFGEIYSRKFGTRWEGKEF